MKKLILIAFCVPWIGYVDEVPVWENEMALGANYRSGNTEKSLYTLNVKRERYSDESDWLYGFYGEQGETEGEKTEGMVRASSEYRVRFSNPAYFASVVAQGLHDSIRGIRLRTQLGPSLGMYVMDEGGLKADVAAGFNATYDRGVGESSQYAGYRFSANLNWNFSKQASCYAQVEISGNLEEPLKDYYGWLVLGLKSGLLDSVSLFAELRDEYDNMPDAVGSKRNDLLFNLGLMYDF